MDTQKTRFAPARADSYAWGYRVGEIDVRLGGTRAWAQAIATKRGQTLIRLAPLSAAEVADQRRSGMQP